jgi:hypothetical protein
MKKLTGLAAVAALAFSGSALAEGPSWNYVEAYYALGDAAGNDDNDIVGLNGSIGMFGFLHGSLNWAVNSIDDEDNASVDDVDLWALRVGLHSDVTDSTDVYADLIYGEIAPDGTLPGLTGNGEDQDTFGIATGVRSMIGEKLELAAEVSWVDQDDLGDSVQGQISGRYFWLDFMSTGLTYAIGSGIGDEDYLGVDLRFSFGGDLFDR